MAERVAEIRRKYDHCFGCGPANPIGLRLDNFLRDGKVVTAAFSPRHNYSGFSGLLHGGIVATALDEIMAWTAILVEDTMVITGKLDLRFKKPAQVDQDFLLAGELVERRGRRLQLEARMVAGDLVFAEANGLFLATEDLS